MDGRVKDRFLGTLVKAYTSMTKEEWHHMHQAKQTLLVQMKQQVRQLEMSLAKAAHSESDMTQMAAALLAALQEMERIERQVDKLSSVQTETVEVLITPGCQMVGRSLGADVVREVHDRGIEWRFRLPMAALDPTYALNGPIGARAALAQQKAAPFADK